MGDSLHQHLSVGVTAKADAGALEAARQLTMVVDLTVERHHPASVGRHHRLVPGLAQVEDGQAGVCQRHARVAVHPAFPAVGAPVDQVVGHDGGDVLQPVPRHRSRGDAHASDAAHQETSSA